MVGSFHFAFHAEHGLGRHRIRRNGDGTALEAMMAFTVVGSLDETVFARCDRRVRIIGDSAATRSGDTTDEQQNTDLMEF